MPQRQNRAVIAVSVMSRKSIFVKVSTSVFRGLASDEMRIADIALTYAEVIAHAIINYGYMMIKE